jgi:hypothetical protein
MVASVPANADCGQAHAERAQPPDRMGGAASLDPACVVLKPSVRCPRGSTSARSPDPIYHARADELRFGVWLNRSRRVLLTLAAVWVISIFDLGYTLSESGTEDFCEANPLAAKLLGGPEQFVVVYKFGLLGVGTLILLMLRRYAVAELACWFLFVFKLYVAVRWYGYFDCVLNGYVNPVLDASG